MNGENALKGPRTILGCLGASKATLRVPARPLQAIPANLLMRVFWLNLATFNLGGTQWSDEHCVTLCRRPVVCEAGRPRRFFHCSWFARSNTKRPP